MARTRSYAPGAQFDQWTLIEHHPEINRWLARCSCGTERMVFIGHLSSGRSGSCGQCGTRDVHGMSKTPEYRTWNGMRQRCSNPNNARYKDYGGRGIKVDPRWELFEHFYQDMGPRPEGTSLDRIDVDGDYCKANCRWATPKQQMNNLQGQQRYEFQGELLTLAEVAQRLGVARMTLYTRLRRGHSFEEATRMPLQGQHEFGGETLSLKEIARRVGLTEAALRTRLQRGMSMEEATSTQAKRKLGDHDPVELGGEATSLAELSARHGVPLRVIRARLSKGWELASAAAEPHRARGRSS